jgi:hypothetical protein
MSVQNYTAGYFFVASITAAGVDGHLTGLADVSVNWQRPITLYKALDANAPAIVQGKAQGQIVIRGFATTSIEDVMFVSDAAFTGAQPTASIVTVTLSGSPYAGGAVTTASYQGYNTGAGFQFRQISDRMWVMDGLQILEIVD